jgi:hypothetical protein
MDEVGFVLKPRTFVRSLMASVNRPPPLAYCLGDASLVRKSRFAHHAVVDLARKCRSGRAAALGFAAITILTGPAAQSGQLAAQLDYVATAECPAAAAFEAVVARRLGYSPFRSNASERVVVRIEGSGRALVGQLEWRNAAEQWIGERTFPSRSGDCGELVRAMGFALALQLQLMAATSPPPDSRPAAPPRVAQTPPDAHAPPTVVAPPAPTPADKPTETSTAEPRSRLSIAAGGGASVAVGLAPTAVVVGRLFGAVAWSRVAFELGAETSTQSVLHRSDGSGFSERLRLGTLAGCGLRGAWSVCVVGKVGQIRVVGEGVDVPASPSGMLLQGGLRLAVTQTLGRHAHFVLRVGGLSPLAGGTVTLDSMRVWTTPRVAADLGVDLAVRFP